MDNQLHVMLCWFVAASQATVVGDEVKMNNSLVRFLSSKSFSVKLKLITILR